MKLNSLGIFGIVSLFSYTAMVAFSPLAYPGYDWLSMAVSDLSAVGAPAKDLAEQLNALFGPCAVVSVMSVCVSMQNVKQKLIRVGVGFFAAMEWITVAGYKLFPWLSDAPASHPKNVMHIVVTVLVVVFSLAALILITIGGRKNVYQRLSICAAVCLGVMLLGAVGTALMPKAVFGLFERFSTFSAVIFNAILGWYLLRCKFEGAVTEQENDYPGGSAK